MQLQYLAERQIRSTMQPCSDCTFLRREIVNLRGFVSDCFSTMLKRFDGQDQNIQWLMEAMQSLNLKIDKQQAQTTMTEVTESPPVRPPRLTGSAARKRPRMQIEHRIAAAQSQRLVTDQQPQQQQQQKPSLLAAPALQPTTTSTWNMNASPAISLSPSGNINGASGFGANFRSAVTVSPFGDSATSTAVSSLGYRTTGPPNAVHIRQQKHSAEQHQHETESDEGLDAEPSESTGTTTSGTVLMLKAEPLGSDFFEDTSASNADSDTGREEGEIIVAVDDESPEGGADEFVGFMDDESFKEGGDENDDFFETAADEEPTASGYLAGISAQENAELDESGEGAAGTNSVRAKRTTLPIPSSDYAPFIGRDAEMRPFCKQCCISYHHLHHLRRHIQVEHLRLEFRCPLCPFQASRLDRFQFHRSRTHGLRDLLPFVGRREQSKDDQEENITEQYNE